MLVESPKRSDIWSSERSWGRSDLTLPSEMRRTAAPFVDPAGDRDQIGAIRELDFALGREWPRRHGTRFLSMLVVGRPLDMDRARRD